MADGRHADDIRFLLLPFKGGSHDFHGMAHFPELAGESVDGMGHAARKGAIGIGHHEDIHLTPPPAPKNWMNAPSSLHAF
jgi:hypothetical protein